MRPRREREAVSAAAKAPAGRAGPAAGQIAVLMLAQCPHRSRSWPRSSCRTASKGGHQTGRGLGGQRAPAARPLRAAATATAQARMKPLPGPASPRKACWPLPVLPLQRMHKHGCCSPAACSAAEPGQRPPGAARHVLPRRLLQPVLRPIGGGSASSSLPTQMAGNPCSGALRPPPGLSGSPPTPPGT